mmetsp:Transcript_35458/g.42702  ORF Transcript_35458/g.42702 Transcript_35458/m.42702 type:complete len:352 (-) Transcript_35458:504-1559(-)|eukprot:CAMPEP_0197848128 /NCGR_PEP_ID=MMETSP1438-20131217/7938_1 /TAXON_ID=1461541 /ORGANISM="Pterosperma sp., Strain CCMP1384" /LENGTH=351 /DNA_ID=CAMNT_0043460265 /DNA_START=387 /DNA_END=1442 /DNA_ORIENTATION=-
MSVQSKELPLAEFGASYYKKKDDMLGDFIKSDEGEPHVARRKDILAKHPEIRDLFGPDPMIAVQVFAVVGLQTAVALYMAKRNASYLFMAVAAYCAGAFANHNLFLAVHELAHNLAFQSPMANRALAFVANWPTILPFAVSFQKYHLEHHAHQGEDSDTDIPTYAEGYYVTNTLMKIVWVFSQLFFYALRPLFTKPKPPGLAEALNALCCFAYDAALVYYGGWKSLGYLAMSSILGGGMHPIAGHFISEHYAFEKDQETYSYYGPLNIFVYNCGYHNEHHDFPRVPGSRLSKIKELAPEFYDNLHSHSSWSGVIWRYITDPAVGPFNRVRREDGKNRENRRAVMNGKTKTK